MTEKRVDSIEDDPYKDTTSIAARELEIAFEEIMDLSFVLSKEE